MRAARRPARLNGRRNQDLGGRQLDFRVTVVAPSECQDRDDQQHARQECRLDIFRDPQILEGTWNSVIIALWATVLSTVIGTLCAYGLWKRHSRTLTGALYLSLVTPEIVSGIALLALFQWAFRWLH